MFAATYYILLIIYNFSILIYPNDINIKILKLTNFYIVYGGLYYFQFFLIIERIIAILYISSYEKISSKPPYLAVALLISAFFITALHNFFLNDKKLSSIVIGSEILILTIGAFFVYYYLQKRQIKRNQDNPNIFITTNLSAKYQYFENQKTYSLSKALLLVIVTFNSIRLVIGHLLHSLFPNLSLNEFESPPFFLLSLLKTSSIFFVFVYNEPIIKLQIMKLLCIKIKNTSENVKNNKTLFVKANIINSKDNKEIYFNEFQKQWK
ncbi:7TM GPCR, serpentine receptor class e (Sre) family-containing protein [Strongyloides ratti]|uniref:7TM GPCR, serpentine receptor class e (Sre) family-containing protein n=1 Tax=Strongyloides ratti TaxID=34506 RepID=A0A090KXD0_STRRB|nr:7TM GPCR, serpentine receptor class e (Sre) family-containing protein [Strongyloides ratti]CEF62155.1 7TM GPCR, serpentine receptor class e (Sre) family-containing protein [Strongyloides ratti]